MISCEADLCDIFISELNLLDGWTCYPEAAGFDVLAVHQDGRQIGVEAKMQLNAKVAEQILPDRYEFYGKPGPDFRLVIVSKITDASRGIVKMLDYLGVAVMVPRESYDHRLKQCYTFDLAHKLLEVNGREPSHYDWCMFDWNPCERSQVPSMATNLRAGIPCPVRLTPWKEKALIVLAQLRAQGFITTKQIVQHGVSPTAWTQAPGSKPAWLKKGDARGTWVETENLPAFDKQHPEVYEAAMSKVKGLLEKPGRLL